MLHFKTELSNVPEEGVAKERERERETRFNADQAMNDLWKNRCPREPRENPGEGVDQRERGNSRSVSKAREVAVEGFSLSSSTYLQQLERTGQLQGFPKLQDGRGIGVPVTEEPGGGAMLNEVELLEDIPYYRTLQKPHPPLHGHLLSSAPNYPTAPRPRPDYDETAIAIIAPDIRSHPPNSHPLSISTLEHGEQYSPLGCLDAALSALAYLGDLGTDLLVCYVLFAEGRVTWSALTGAFVLLSALVVNILSIDWYARNQRASVYTSASKLTWAVRSVFHLLLVGLLYRYLHLLCNNLCQDRLENREHRSVMEARKRKNAIRQLTIKEDKQTATLCLLHSFLQSAPQLVLQLYTLAQRTDEDKLVTVLIQGICATSSLFQLAWSITSYNHALHRTTPGKRRGNSVGRLLQFLWHFCIIGSRACTLALFTKEYHFWLFPFCIGHWGVMTVWVMHQQTRFCRKGGELHQCKEYIWNMVVGVAYVIYYLNVKAEPTRYKYSAYYAIVFAENCVLMTLWFLRNDPGVWYHIPALVAVFSSFASGIVFMLFYYGFCHRTLKQTNEKRAAHCC